MAVLTMGCSACVASKPARTYGPNDPQPPHSKAEAEQHTARVRPDASNELACSDPSTQKISPDVARSRVGKWRGWSPEDAMGDGYRPPAMTARAPFARYPKALLDQGEPGAVMAMIFIDVDGLVDDVQIICSTNDAFIDYAKRAVVGNRYQPTMIDGRLVRDVAVQVYSYVVGD
jgi:outer membrane biosynthesis protein TonB